MITIHEYDPPSAKTCTKCKETLSLDHFGKNSASKDGLRYVCKQCNNQSAKDYARNNKELIKSKSAVYRNNNRDRMREYKKANKERMVILEQRRRAAKQISLDSLTLNDWSSIKATYNYTCLCCKKSEPEIKLEIDHVIPLSRGGSHSKDNIQPLCGACNRSKYNSTIDYRK